MRNIDLEITLSYEDVMTALAGLRPEELVEFIKDAEERAGDWSIIAQLKPWVDKQHRAMVTEETEDLAKRSGKCQRSAQYEDIWVHVDPHVGCVLR